jgi:hypothetical protein
MGIAKEVIIDLSDQLHEVMLDASRQSTKSTQRITAAWHAGLARGIAMAINAITVAAETDQEFIYIDDMSLEALIERFTSATTNQEPVQ